MSIYLYNKITFCARNKRIRGDILKEMQKIFAFRVLLYYICIVNK